MYRIVCTLTGDNPLTDTLTGKINDISFEGDEEITLDDFTFKIYKNVKCIKNAEMKDYISLVVRFENKSYIHYMLDYKNHEFILNKDGYIVNANYDKLNLYDPDSHMDLWFDITRQYELSESEEYCINYYDSTLGISIDIGYCSLRNRWFEMSTNLNTKNRIILRENMKICICVNTSYLLWQMVDWRPYKIIT